MALDDGGKKEYFTYEKYLTAKSDYKKFNTNFYPIEMDDDDMFTATCQAFSHYTYDNSGQTMVVCDLQGVVSGSRLVLTDPAIHCTNILWHGSTNLGTDGIEHFFHIHTCNDICHEMKLKHPNNIALDESEL